MIHDYYKEDFPEFCAAKIICGFEYDSGIKDDIRNMHITKEEFEADNRTIVRDIIYYTRNVAIMETPAGRSTVDGSDFFNSNSIVLIAFNEDQIMTKNFILKEIKKVKTLKAKLLYSITNPKSGKKCWLYGIKHNQIV